ncbi:alpha/beta hydrolase [Streptomyces sp. NPDC001840]
MPTWQQLRDAKLNEYEDAADGWGRVSSRANAAKDRVDNEMLAGIRGTQRGEAATGAVADLERLSRNYQYIHTECGLIRTALNGLATELAAPQRKLGQALEDAENARFTVHPDGSVEYPASADVPVPLAPGRGGTARPGAPVPLLPGLAEGNDDPNRARAEELAERIAAAVREATEIDGRYAGVLRELNTTGGLTVDDSMFADAAQDTRRLQQTARDHADAQDIPHDRPAAENAAWWRGLTQEQRDEYATMYPASIGALDGLPAAVRDDANRMVLAETRAQYQQELRGIPPEPYPQKVFGGLRIGMVYSDEWIRWNEQYGDRKAHLDSSLRGMNAIQDRFDATGTNGLPEACLLGFSAEGNGRAIVANGNPDTADHTAVYVPGTTSNLGRIDGDIGRMTDLWRASAALPGSGSVSTVTWLGYDAPQNIVKDSPFSHYADDGAPAFNSFMDGLDTANTTASGGHHTAVGHSYGTTLIGSAARQGELNADDVVFAGSPGVQVGSAEEMDVPRGHVWNEEAEGDPVPDIGRWGHGGSQWRLGGGVFLIPSDEPFGANQMATDTTGHSDYWNQDTESLRNQAAVVTGNYSMVQLND